jgi:hypothetical protein
MVWSSLHLLAALTPIQRFGWKNFQSGTDSRRFVGLRCKLRNNTAAVTTELLHIRFRRRARLSGLALQSGLAIDMEMIISSSGDFGKFAGHMKVTDCADTLSSRLLVQCRAATVFSGYCV